MRHTAPNEWDFTTAILQGSSPMTFLRLFAAGTLSFMMFSSASKAADIVDTAVSAGSFTTLVAAVKAADLVGTLEKSRAIHRVRSY